jgi:hypothetical protein
MDQTQTYRIRVRGYLDDKYSDCVHGMTITPVNAEKEKGDTFLYGQLPDQAALSGVMSYLYDQQLPVVSVEIVEDE